MHTVLKDKLDLTTWKRRDHFNFFKTFHQPFWGITTAINCTQAYAYCKAANVSFFMYYLYQSLSAANSIREFKYRMEGDDVYEYRSISGSITVLRNDETFGFAYFDYNDDFNTFSKDTKLKLTAAKVTSGLRTDVNINNVIYYSILPGINFTSMQHAQHLGIQSSVPMIVFGQYQHSNGQVLLPISVHVHHALCDGLHVEKYIKLFQSKMELGG
ncbi:CatA-like O-acetyltransferase [Mucilaginibacter sp. X4EP1]|jgi:chloramphenicol O-acetyltransferase type A|uniref:chloramphenicol acetyltransferase n=1 Tax=Mucilaginibacter sp. X4EP1 TaxID=2723092 RepID=UPI0021674EB0|nr:chloramphenicol acetyltransferase [Mucilaginibacter sp. X4EP1]MCS3811597.1 chloramphenicol O-acetyltransferase type A [Mucilaginibacter sp. X4EP1]